MRGHSGVQVSFTPGAGLRAQAWPLALVDRRHPAGHVAAVHRGATQIGLQLGIVSRASAAGLVAAGLLSVVIFPALGLVLLRRQRPETATPRALPPPVMPVLTTEDRALCRPSSVEPAA